MCQADIPALPECGTGAAVALLGRRLPHMIGEPVERRTRQDPEVARRGIEHEETIARFDVRLELVRPRPGSLRRSDDPHACEVVPPFVHRLDHRDDGVRVSPRPGLVGNEQRSLAAGHLSSPITLRGEEWMGRDGWGRGASALGGVVAPAGSDAGWTERVRGAQDLKRRAPDGSMLLGGLAGDRTRNNTA